MKLTREYIPFYLDGREERTIKNEVDLKQLAAKVLAGGGDLREACQAAAAEDLRAKLELDRKRKVWLNDFADEVTEAGGDKDLAYKHFCAGRFDELAAVLEDEIVEQMNATLGASDDDDDDDDDDDCEDGEDEGGEDEDDEKDD